jgi:glycosyltransferase involved in cell wall biosynthesis
MGNLKGTARSGRYAYLPDDKRNVFAGSAAARRGRDFEASNPSSADGGRSRKPRVVYWNNQPTPYVVDRFNALAKRDCLDFEAWFSSRREWDRDWDVNEGEWHFPHRYLPSVSLGGHVLALSALAVARRAPDLIVSLYGHMSYVLGFALARMRSVKTVFWVEPTFDAWMRRGPIKDRLKSFMFTNVDAIFTTGSDGRRFAERFNADTNQIYRLPYFNQFNYFNSARAGGLRERTRLRNALGLRGVTFLYVGRLWKGKGVHHLLDAFKSLQLSCAEPVSLMIVGDGEESHALRDRCREESISHVAFTGFKQRSELPNYYAATDVFVFPTLGDPYGLVLDEAMASGLPVITTDAVGELADRVQDGVTGLVVPARDGAALTEKMRLLAVNPQLRHQLSCAGSARVANGTAEKWALDFEQAVSRVLSGRTMR